MTQKELPLGDHGLVERRFFISAAEDAGEEVNEFPLLRVERRARADGSIGEGTPWIVGYAARFGVDSLDGAVGEFTERIDPSAFAIVSERRGRKKPLMTRALFNHNSDMPLARYPETLSLTVDDTGLRYEFPVPDTTYGKDLLALIEGGIVRGSSFAFIVAQGGDQWSVDDNGRSIRTITRVSDLFDVGPVTYPAYGDGGLEVARRSFDLFAKRSKQEAELREKRAAAEAVVHARRASLMEWFQANAAR